MYQVFQNPKSGKTKVKNITPPKLKKGGIIVNNKYSLISPGTEKGLIELSKKGLLQKAKERPDYVKKFIKLAKTKGIKAAWQMAQAKLSTEIPLGYSTSGNVEKVADDVEGFQAGDRVACAGQDYASHAEKVFIPKNLAVKIPKNVTDKEASFATLGSIALHGIHQADLKPGESVAVIGLGLLGQLATRMLKAYGHPVIGFDVKKRPLDYAKKHSDIDYAVKTEKKSYQSVLSKLTDGQGVDAVLIYASAKNSKPIELASKIARDRGKIVQIGNTDPDIPWRTFYQKELSFNSSRSYGPGRYDKSYEEEGNDYPIGHVRFTERRNMKEFLRLLDDDKIKVEDLLTAEFDIEEAHQAYDMIMNSKKQIFGLLLKYPEKKKKEDEDVIVLTDNPTPLPGREEVNIGIIGLGSFATSTILPHLKNVKDETVNLIGVANTTGNKAKDIGKEWDAEYVTNDYKKLIEDKRINMIICATRHSSHAKMAQEILKAGKNLYIEKPIALNKKDLKDIVNAAQGSRARLLVGFNRRFSKHFKRAYKEFGETSVPTMINYRINYPFEDKEHWSYDPDEGGRIIGEMSHFAHAFRYITDSRPTRVYASVVPTGEGVQREENAVINIEFEDGSIGNIFYSALGSNQVSKEYIEIYGGNKIMTVDDFKKGMLYHHEDKEKIKFRHQDKGYDAELQEFIQSIREGKPSPMTLEEIIDAHLAIFAAYHSYKDGEVKEIEPPKVN
ncbi:MAG TPA: bi-domain-containing oxidoreductase [Candidatus Paceibacterota bacterium]|nr:bi-domain-containing oxidoreductase [Candidatus Paceibacterota bacterium]